MEKTYTENELIQILNNAYENSTNGEAVLTIHLFGIKYAAPLKELKSLKDFVEKSNISNSYQTEISKGIKLAKYVSIKSGSPI